MARTQPNNDKALGAFITTKLEIDALIQRIQTLKDNHFNKDPDEVNWGDVETLRYYRGMLKRITDAAFKEGEYAE